MKNASSRKNFDLEALEARVLLDATVPSAAIAPAPMNETLSTGISVEQGATSTGMGEGIAYSPEAQVNSIFDTSAATPEPELAATESQTAVTASTEIASAQSKPEGSQAPGAGGETPVSAPAETSSMTEQLTETLHVANAPPETLASTLNQVSSAVVSAASTITRPLLLLPGIAGTFAIDSYANEWFTHRGIAPDKLQIDPLGGVYNDLIRTLQNVGYVLGKTLFVANYDWRVDPAPNDGSFDGHITGLTGDSITDDTYEYGVDYLGYWLEQAASVWKQDHNNSAPADVDVIAHSTGGLVARAYIESDAYGAQLTSKPSLPEIHDLIMVGVPNRGASKAWNILQDNWAIDPAFRFVLSKMVDHAYSLWTQGQTIQGPTPTEDITAGMNLTQEQFIEAYIPTARGLLATYPFIDRADDSQPVFKTVNTSADDANFSTDRNWLLLDLNDGLDVDYSPGQLSVNGDGDLAFGLRKPTGFIDELSGDLAVIYSSEESTPTNVQQHVGPFISKLGDDIVSLDSFASRRPDSNEIWWEDLSKVRNGDGTVPLESSWQLFASDPDSQIKRDQITQMDHSTYNEKLDHTGLMWAKASQQKILDELGIAYTDVAISRGSVLGALQSLTQAVNLGILDAHDLLKAAGQFDAAAVDAIRLGLGQVRLLMQKLSSSDLFTKTLPIVNKSLSSMINLGDLVDRYIVAPVLTWIDDLQKANQLPSINDFIQKLNGLTVPGTNHRDLAILINTTYSLSESGQPSGSDLVSVLENYLGLGTSANDDQLLIGLSIRITQTEHLGLDLGRNGQTQALTFGADTNIDAQAFADLDLTLGIDRTAGKPLNERFFIVPGDFNLRTGVNFQASDFAAKLNVGLLEVGIQNGAVDLNAAVNIGFRDPNGDGRITLLELESSGSPVVLTPSGAFHATLNFFGNLSVFSASGKLTISAPELFGDADPVVNFQPDTPSLPNWKNLTAHDIIDLLQRLGTKLQDLAKDLKIAIPFSQQTIDKAVNFVELLSNLTRKLFDVELNDTYQYSAPNAPTSFALTDDAVFQIALDDGPLQTYTLAKGNRANLQAIVNDLNHALAGSSVTASVDEDRINFSTDPSKVLTVRFRADNKGMEQLGFAVTVANAVFRFGTIQQLSDLLASITGGTVNMRYDGDNSILAFDLSFEESIEKIFSLDFTQEINLGIAKLALTGFADANLSAEARISATIQIDLTQIGGRLKFDEMTRLTDIPAVSGSHGRGAITVQIVADHDAPSVTAILGDRDVSSDLGQLSSDATFTLTGFTGADGDSPVTAILTVRKLDTENNGQIDDLVDDLNSVLATSSLNGRVAAQAHDHHLRFVAIDTSSAHLPTLHQLFFTAEARNSAITQMGFSSGVESMSLWNGQLSADATFQLSINGLQPIKIVVTTQSTQAHDNDEANESIDDLVDDINAALTIGVGAGRITAYGDDHRLRLMANDPTIRKLELIAESENTAVKEMGFAPEQNSAQLSIILRDGSPVFVELGGATTLGDVKEAILRASTGKVEVMLDDNAKRIVLINSTAGSGHTFSVSNSNDSMIGMALGIVGQDGNDDGTIEGTALHGDSIFNHVSLANASFTASAHFNADVDMTAAIGFLELGIARGEINDLSVGFAAEVVTDDSGFHAVTPTLTASGQIVLPIFVTGLEEIGLEDIGHNPEDPQDPNPAITLSFRVQDGKVAYNADFAALNEIIDSFKDFSSDNLLLLAQNILGMLQSDGFGILNQSIPVINKSLSQLIGFLDDAIAHVSAFSNQVQRLRADLLGELSKIRGVLADVGTKLDDGDLAKKIGAARIETAKKIYQRILNAFNALDSALNKLVGSSLFVASDFTDLPGLVRRLVDHTDAVSKYLWGQFSLKSQGVLNNSASKEAQLRSVLVQELNKLLRGSSLYGAKNGVVPIFEGIELSPDATSLLEKDPQGDDLIHLNRLLLESADKMELAKVDLRNNGGGVAGVINALIFKVPAALVSALGEFSSALIALQIEVNAWPVTAASTSPFASPSTTISDLNDDLTEISHSLSLIREKLPTAKRIATILFNLLGLKLPNFGEIQKVMDGLTTRIDDLKAKLTAIGKSADAILADLNKAKSLISNASTALDPLALARGFDALRAAIDSVDLSGLPNVIVERQQLDAILMLLSARFSDRLVLSLVNKNLIVSLHYGVDFDARQNYLTNLNLKDLAFLDIPVRATLGSDAQLHFAGGFTLDTAFGVDLSNKTIEASDFYLVDEATTFDFHARGSIAGTAELRVAGARIANAQVVIRLTSANTQQEFDADGMTADFGLSDAPVYTDQLDTAVVAFGSAGSETVQKADSYMIAADLNATGQTLSFKTIPVAGTHITIRYPTDNAGFTIKVRDPTTAGNDHRIPFADVFDYVQSPMLDAALRVRLSFSSALGSFAAVAFVDLRDSNNSFYKLDGNLADFNIKLDLSDLMNGLDQLLGLIADALQNKIVGKLPLIGHDLNTAGSKIEQLQAKLRVIKDRLNEIQEDLTPDRIEMEVRTILYEELGPLGLGILDVTKPEDIDVRACIAAGKNLATDPDATLELPLLHFLWQDKYTATFNLGVSAFNLIGVQGAGAIDIIAGFDLNIGFLLNKNDGLVLKLNGSSPSCKTPNAPLQEASKPEINLSLEVRLAPGTTIEANFFFLDFEAASQSTFIATSVTMDLSSDDTSHPYEIPLWKLTSLDATPRLPSFEANVDFNLTASIAHNKNLPTIQAEFVAQWSDTDDSGKKKEWSLDGLLVPDFVGFLDVRLDLGQFISGAVKAVFQDLNRFLAPVKPLLDLLDEEIPVISDLSKLFGLGPMTFADGIELFGEGGESVVHVLRLLKGAVDFVGRASSISGGLFFEYGDIPLFGTAVHVAQAPGSSGGVAASPTKAALSVSWPAGIRKFFTDAQDKLGISFPLIAGFLDGQIDPGDLLVMKNLLLGQTVDLITWDLPRLETSFSFSWVTPAPILPPFPIYGEIGGSFGMFAHFFIGLDSRGLRTGDFLNGLYFGDRADGATGADVPEIGVFAEFTVGAIVKIPDFPSFAGLSVHISAGVEGGIRSDLTANWNDPDGDGKVYLDEIQTNLARGFDCIFDLEGRFSAFVRTYVKIWFEIKVWKWKKTITLVNIDRTLVDVTLFDFKISCPPLPPPEPATAEGTTLWLNIGPRAGVRQPGAKDGDESVIVRGEYDVNGDGKISQTVDRNGDGMISEDELGDDLNNDGKFTDGVVAVTGFGQTRLFSQITDIRGDAGEGDDSVTFDHVRLPSRLTGGPGDDTIQGGDMNDAIRGGSGEDQIAGGSGDDELDGDGGNDVIFGNAGGDQIWGGSGDDLLYGGSNDNKDQGDTGDIIYGEAGDDRIYGHLGADELHGGAGRDEIQGGAGNDTLYGDDDEDTLFGEDGNDTVFGGNGNDELLGGLGNDTLSGDAGDDALWGDFKVENFIPDAHGNINVIQFGRGGDDILSGGPGADLLIGGDGNDRLYGNEGGDHILGDYGTLNAIDATVNLFEKGPMGDDYVEGGPDQDQIFGQGGNDAIIGGSSTAAVDVGDFVEGGEGDDIILGDNGCIYYAALSNQTPNCAMLAITNPNGGAGNDTIYGGEGNDIIFGGGGNDYLAGDSLQDSGIDIVVGDDGAYDADHVTSTSSTHAGEDMIFGGARNDLLFGGGMADTIAGDADDDIIIGDDGTVFLISRTSLLFGKIVSDAVDGGDDTLTGSDGFDIVLGGPGRDKIFGGNGDDILLGDNGEVNASNGGLIESIRAALPAAGTSDNVHWEDQIQGDNGADFILGGLDGDEITGGNGADIVFGDDAEILVKDQDGLPGTLVLFATRARVVDNTVGGHDVISGGADEDVLAGGAAADQIDGDSGKDLIFGDNVQLDRVTLSSSPRFRVVDGELYDAQGAPTVTADWQLDPTGTPTWANWRIILLDHSSANEVASNNSFGADQIAGGSESDMIFGELGADVIQGDGSTSLNLSRANLLSGDDFAAADTDGDDYIEGGGGGDLIFGNLGQDDIIGGSSDWFGLGNAEQRPDGSDLIFGGSGGATSRNHSGDASARGHARDSDMILGDNGRIYRIVEITNSQISYRSFNYDRYRDETPTILIVVRGADLLDYTPGGPDLYPTLARLDLGKVSSDIGEADEIHGEAGDDVIYGMVGNDMLFGDGQDDDLIGGYGNDWISGGAGQDGILGDDGRIFTSRNSAGYGEPLYGIGNVTEINKLISTPGHVQEAIINVDQALRKSVDLTPFNLDPSTAQDPLYPAKYADDIIFGGLGDDFLHGGAGDDAISGAEAQPISFLQGLSQGLLVAVQSDFFHPYNPGNALRFGADTDAAHSNNHIAARLGEFALYDEFDPRRTIVLGTDGNAVKSGTGLQWFLNFDDREGPALPGGVTDKGEAYGPANTDGDDVIFGDLGNDWLVGGTGKDTLWGGFGNDLMNADDVLTTGISTGATNGHKIQSSPNDTPDTHPSYEDRVFGGAGLDVLIGNTGGDRLIDWVGEFNSYIVPFAPFGVATVSRQRPPLLDEFLYALSGSQGADPTRAADAHSESARNGEPYGEIGLVTQKDHTLWHDQTGGPSDPQPGNVSGGKRDVLRTAFFDSAGPNGFAVDSGLWKTTNGLYEATPSRTSTDAVSLMLLDDSLPYYFEIQTTVNANKPKAGVKSNGYLIFDFQSSKDFKYAGVDVGSRRLVIGQRTAHGWVDLAQSNMRLDAFTDYDLKVAINGPSVSLTVRGNNALKYDFQTVLNTGMIGVGADNSMSRFDNVDVLVLSSTAVYDQQSGSSVNKRDVLTSVSFDTNTPNPFSTQAGTWKSSNNSYEAAPVSGGDALGTISVQQGLPHYWEMLVTINANKAKAGVKSNAYIIFDYRSPTDFKYAGVDVALGQVQIGKRSAAGWTNLAQAQLRLDALVDQQLKLVVNGDTASLQVNGSNQLTVAFGQALNAGLIGVGTSNAVSRFDNFSVQVLSPALPLSIQESFTESHSMPISSQSGSWSINNGHYQGVIPQGDDNATSVWNVNVDSSTALRVAATVNTVAFGGLIFDYQDEFHFKFVALMASTHQLAIGHRTLFSWSLDSVIDYAIGGGTDYKLAATIGPSSISVSVNGQALLNWSDATLLTDGNIGFFTLKGSTTFDDLSIQAFVP